MGCTIQGLNTSENKRFFSKIPKLVLGPNAVSFPMDMVIFSQWWDGGGE
jgi:hypothetical protein